MSSWPSMLPNPTVDFNGSNESSVVRTQMESGRYRQRQRFTCEHRIYPVSWQMSDFQFGMFQSWFIHKISNGSDFFDISIPTGGDGFKTVSARFVDGKYSFKHDGVLYWNVKGQIEVEDADVWDESVYDALEEIGDPVLLESSADYLHTIIHETLPSYF